MGVLATIKNTIQKGATTFRYPTFTSGLGGGMGGGYGYWNDWLVANLLPGSDFDYIAEAGDLWKCSVVAACLNFLMKTFPQPRLVLMEMIKSADGLTEQTSFAHPILELLNNPNLDDDDLTFLLQAWVMDWNLYGNVYWLMLRNNGGTGRVVGLQYIPRQLMKPLIDPTGQRRVGGYAYYCDGRYIIYSRENIIHWKFGQDPQNPREGLSPLLATCRDICTENELSTLAASVARNMGIVPYLVGPASTEAHAVIEKDTRTALEQQWDSRKRDNRGKPIFMRQAFKVDKIGLSPQELMADEARAVAVSRICGALGVSPMVIDLPSDSKTYSNMGEAHRAVYDHNIIPSGDAFATTITRRFRNEPGYVLAPNQRIGWDYSLVPAMQEDKNLLHKRVQQDFIGGYITIDDARKETGRGTDPTYGKKYLWEVKADIASAQQQMQADSQAQLQQNQDAGKDKAK